MFIHAVFPKTSPYDNFSFPKILVSKDFTTASPDSL